MNACLIKGAALYSMGFAQEIYGSVIGNNELRLYGDQMKTCGKFQIMIGEAQYIIARCVEQKEANKKLALKVTQPSAEIISFGITPLTVSRRFPLPRLVVGLSNSIRRNVVSH